MTFPESKSLECLLSHLSHQQVAIVYAMLEANTKHTSERDWAGDIPANARQHEDIMRRVRAYIIGDGRMDFDAVLVPLAEQWIRNVGLTRPKESGNLTKRKR